MIPWINQKKEANNNTYTPLYLQQLDLIEIIILDFFFSTVDLTNG